MMKNSFLYLTVVCSTGFCLSSSALFCELRTNKTSASSAINTDTFQDRDRITQEVNNVISGLMQSLRDHEISKGYYAFTTRSFRTTTSRDGFQTFVLKNPVLSKNVTASLMEPSFQDNMIVVKGVLTSIDEQRNIVEFALIKEDSQWKILGMKVFPNTPSK